MKITGRHRGLYRAIAGLGSGIAEDRLTGHERRLVRSLAGGGYLRVDAGMIWAVPPFELAAEARGALAGEAHPVDLSDRDADWKPPITSKGERPVLCVSVPDEAHGRLKALGPDRVRSLLADVAVLGHDAALQVLGDLPALSPVSRSARKVYGIAIPKSWAEFLRGKGLTQRTAAVLVAALEVDFDLAAEAIEKAREAA